MSRHTTTNGQELPQGLLGKFLQDNTDPEKCWPWKSFTAKTGYPSVWGGNKRMSLHRYMYELHKGKIPEGLVVDHLCRNHNCGNPNHLEAVTNRENIMRGENWCAKNAQKTHCLKGHEYIPENTYITRRGRRDCRICHSGFNKSYRDRDRIIKQIREEENKLSEQKQIEKEACKRLLAKLRERMEQIIMNPDSNRRQTLKEVLALLADPTT